MFLITITIESQNTSYLPTLVDLILNAKIFKQFRCCFCLIEVSEYFNNDIFQLLSEIIPLSDYNS